MGHCPIRKLFLHSFPHMARAPTHSLITAVWSDGRDADCSLGHEGDLERMDRGQTDGNKPLANHRSRSTRPGSSMDQPLLRCLLERSSARSRRLAMDER